MPRGEMLTIEDVLEILSTPLLGIIPESEEVLRASNFGSPITISILSMRRTAIFTPLCLIGRYSLPVFATGAILCTIGLAVMDEDWPGMPYSLFVLAGGLAIHYVVARYLSTRSESRRNRIVIDRPVGGFLGAGTASGADRASPLPFLSSRRRAHTDGFPQYLDT